MLVLLKISFAKIYQKIIAFSLSVVLLCIPVFAEQLTYESVPIVFETPYFVVWSENGENLTEDYEVYPDDWRIYLTNSDDDIWGINGALMYVSYESNPQTAGNLILGTSNFPVNEYSAGGTISGQISLGSDHANVYWSDCYITFYYNEGGVNKIYEVHSDLVGSDFESAWSFDIDLEFNDSAVINRFEINWSKFRPVDTSGSYVYLNDYRCYFTEFLLNCNTNISSGDNTQVIINQIAEVNSFLDNMWNDPLPSDPSISDASKPVLNQEQQIVNQVAGGKTEFNNQISSGNSFLSSATRYTVALSAVGNWLTTWLAMPFLSNLLQIAIPLGLFASILGVGYTVYSVKVSNEKRLASDIARAEKDKMRSIANQKDRYYADNFGIWRR